MQGHIIMYRYKKYVRSTDIVGMFMLSLKHEVIVFCGLYKHYRCKRTAPNSSLVVALQMQTYCP